MAVSPGLVWPMVAVKSPNSLMVELTDAFSIGLEEMVQDRYTLGSAATALYQLDPAAHNRHLDVYVANLKRGDWWGHVAAAEAVGRMGPAAREAILYLHRLRYYVTSRDVREAAEAALKKIRAED